MRIAVDNYLPAKGTPKGFNLNLKINSEIVSIVLPTDMDVEISVQKLTKTIVIILQAIKLQLPHE